MGYKQKMRMAGFSTVFLRRPQKVDPGDLTFTQ